MKSKDGKRPDMSDWENRVLCSDGNCIGVIGPDGRCKECGKRYKGELPFDKTDSEADDAVEADDSDRQSENENEPPATDQKPSLPTGDDELDWENRKLCSDGSCIGVIGPDGKCKECGKPYSGDPE